MESRLPADTSATFWLVLQWNIWLGCVVNLVMVDCRLTHQPHSDRYCSETFDWVVCWIYWWSIAGRHISHILIGIAVKHLTALYDESMAVRLLADTSTTFWSVLQWNIWLGCMVNPWIVDCRLTHKPHSDWYCSQTFDWVVCWVYWWSVAGWHISHILIGIAVKHLTALCGKSMDGRISTTTCPSCLIYQLCILTKACCRQHCLWRHSPTQSLSHEPHTLPTIWSPTNIHTCLPITHKTSVPKFSLFTLHMLVF